MKTVGKVLRLDTTSIKKCGSTKKERQIFESVLAKGIGTENIQSYQGPKIVFGRNIGTPLCLDLPELPPITFARKKR